MSAARSYLIAVALWPGGTKKLWIVPERVEYGEVAEHLGAAGGPDWYYHGCGFFNDGLSWETILNEAVTW